MADHCTGCGVRLDALGNTDAQREHITKCTGSDPAAETQPIDLGFTRTDRADSDRVERKDRMG